MLRVIQRLFGFVPARTAVVPPGQTTLVYVRVRDRENSQQSASVDRVAAVNLSKEGDTTGRSASIQTDLLLPTQQEASPACTVMADAARDRVSLHRRSALPGHRQSGEIKLEPISCLRIFSRKWVTALNSVEVATVGQLATCDPVQVGVRIKQSGGGTVGIGRSSAAIASKIARVQRLIRYSGRFSDMTVAEAELLFAVHRRSRKQLAQDSVAMLRRDLQRFGLSSRGQNMVKRIDFPSFGRVRSWIEQARQAEAVRRTTQREMTATGSLHHGG